MTKGVEKWGNHSFSGKILKFWTKDTEVFKKILVQKHPELRCGINEAPGCNIRNTMYCSIPSSISLLRENFANKSYAKLATLSFMGVNLFVATHNYRKNTVIEYVTWSPPDANEMFIIEKWYKIRRCASLSITLKPSSETTKLTFRFAYLRSEFFQQKFEKFWILLAKRIKKICCLPGPAPINFSTLFSTLRFLSTENVPAATPTR